MQIQEEKVEISVQPLENPWRVFGWEVFLFSVTLALGLVSAFRLNKVLIQNGALKEEVSYITPISLWQFLLYFLSTTLFIVLALRFIRAKAKREIFFKIIFISATFLGGLVFLNLWMSDLLTLLTIFLLIFWWLKWPSVFIHDLAMILGLIGISLILSLRFSPWTIVFILIILSVYDFIAVYKTHHMIEIARKMTEAGAVLGLIFPQTIAGFEANIGSIKPGGKFLILGGGDIAFPLILSSSLISQGVPQSLIVAIFSLIGLFFSFLIFINQKTRAPIPALPPIALFSIIGFLITQII